MYTNPPQQYLNLLRTHHRVAIEVYIMDSARRVLFDVSKDLISGVVDIDTENKDSSRFGKLTVLDPQQRLSIDLNGVGWGSNMSNRLLHIVHRVYAMDWSYTFAVPIFTGPITDSKRDGVVLHMEFKGLESLVGVGQLRDYTWPAGQFRTEVIMNAVNISSGEQYFADAGAGQILHSAWSVEGGENLWHRLKELADGGGLNIYFNGDGVLQIKQKTNQSCMVIDSTWLTEEPDQSLDISKLRNVVRVEGANIPGTDQKMIYEAWPPADHPFSPQRLARNGVLRIMPHRINDTSLGVWADIVSAAWSNLEWDLLVAESNTAVIAVAPFLEEFDVLTIAHPKLYAHSPLTKATIPLVGDGEMSLNMFTTTSSGSARGGMGVGNLNAALWGSSGGGGKPNTDRLLKHHSSAATSWGAGIKKGGKKYGSQSGSDFDLNPNKGKKKKNRNRKGGK